MYLRRVKCNYVERETTENAEVEFNNFNRIFISCINQYVKSYKGALQISTTGN